MASEEYIVIPGTHQKVYAGSVVVLYRLPGVRWIIHNGYYNYSGRRQKGWYFSSVPSDTVMPVFNEDLVAMRVVDSPMPPVPPVPPGPIPPFPPGPIPPCPPGPHPPAPVPIPFTPQDKAQIDSAMITVDDLASRDIMGREGLQNGKIVRVNDIDGHGTVEYYSWNAITCQWDVASLGYRYMTREEMLDTISSDVIDIAWVNENGALVLTNHGGTSTDPIQLLGVTHDPTYNGDQLKLTIPVYGKDPFEMTIPRDTYPKAIRFEDNWVFEDGHTGRAIVVTVSDGLTDTDIAGDVSALALTSELEGTEERVSDIQTKIDFSSGQDGDILVSSNANIRRSNYIVGGDTIDFSNPSGKVATESAVADVVSWADF